MGCRRMRAVREEMISFGILLAPRMAGRVDSRCPVSFVGSQTSGAFGRPVRYACARGGGSREQGILASGAAQETASNRPLPGAETALFL